GGWRGGGGEGGGGWGRGGRGPGGRGGGGRGKGARGLAGWARWHYFAICSSQPPPRRRALARSQAGSAAFSSFTYAPRCPPGTSLYEPRDRSLPHRWGARKPCATECSSPYTQSIPSPWASPPALRSSLPSASSPPLGGEARRGGKRVRRPLSQPLPLTGERRKKERGRLRHEFEPPLSRPPCRARRACRRRPWNWRSCRPCPCGHSRGYPG